VDGEENGDENGDGNGDGNNSFADNAAWMGSKRGAGFTTPRIALEFMSFSFWVFPSGDASTRWFFWAASMCPFMYIVYTLFVGLKDSQEAQPEACREQVKWACWATVFSWCTYPVVYILPMMSGSETGKAGLSAQAITAVQTGYTISDIISKCGVGYLVYRIGLAKSGAGKFDDMEA